MQMTKGILIGMLIGVVCLGCGKTKPPTGGTSGEKASTGGSANTGSVDRQPGKVMTNSIGMKLVYIQPGEFQMGSNDGGNFENPLHTVKITKGFYMGVYEVTQEQYQKVMGTNPSNFKGEDNLPVEAVSWDNALEFCTKLSQKEGKTYRLPTEAEWEYACRAGTTTKFSFGDDESQLGDYAWYIQNSGMNMKTHPVGEKKPNAWGLYDMAGNVWEWCQDWYAKDWYSKGPAENPLNESYGDKNSRVIRGGSWGGGSVLCRVSIRGSYGPILRSDYIGFRVVLDSNPEEPKSNKESGKVATSSAELSTQAKASLPPVSAEVKPMPSNPQQGTLWENSIGMKLVYIQPGEFQMGSNGSDRDDEKPIHTVTISKGFYMGIYEVTQEQYQKVMGINPSKFKGEDNLPVETVSWDDVVEFCKKLSQTEGKTYRLPTEAEWEYACRAGTTTKFSFGDDESQLDDYAWYTQNSGGKTHPVGEKNPNAWGLYDMLGNVWEWCQDRNAKDWYSKGPVENPLNESYGDKNCRVIRGGSWGYGSNECRVSLRGYGTPGIRGDDLGFRVVRGF
jgi:formylglycine-generating enzyme required for sulfatase activity